MSEPPDLDALAKQYLNLWQQQLGGISKDQQTAEIMAQTMELMNAGASAFATMATQNQGYADADASSSPSTAASGASPGASDLDVAELARRIARLEKRLDSLETGVKKSRRKTAKKPRKN
jgi:hypothetical protein